jgi:hypothetical protein
MQYELKVYPKFYSFHNLKNSYVIGIGRSRKVLFALSSKLYRLISFTYKYRDIILS